LSQLIDYVIDNAILFNYLINIYIAGSGRISQRAAGVLNVLALRNERLLRSHYGKLVRVLGDSSVPNRLKRNTVRLFQFVDIPATYRGRVVDLCFGFLLDKKETIAVKVFSMTVLERLAQGSPELLRELVMVIEDQLPYAGPAFRSRAAKILKRIR
jgi:hypothetical protein